MSSAARNPAATTSATEALARLLRALGNAHRLRILRHLLAAGEASAGELAAQLGLGASTLSQHLRRMLDEDLVRSRRRARLILYRPGPALTTAPERLRAILAVPAATGRAPTAYQPAPDVETRLVFNTTAAAPQPEAVHPALVRVARTFDLYRAAGIAAGALQAVLVLGGPACAVALGDAAYRARHGCANPNRGTLRALHAAGLEVVACGQTLDAEALGAEALAEGVVIGLSGVTALVELQRRGHALVPL